MSKEHLTAVISDLLTLVKNKQTNKNKSMYCMWPRTPCQNAFCETKQQNLTLLNCYKTPEQRLVPSVNRVFQSSRVGHASNVRWNYSLQWARLSKCWQLRRYNSYSLIRTQTVRNVPTWKNLSTENTIPGFRLLICVKCSFPALEITSNIDQRYEQFIASSSEILTQTFWHRFSSLSPSPPGSSAELSSSRWW